MYKYFFILIRNKEIKQPNIKLTKMVQHRKILPLEDPFDYIL